MVLRGGEDVCKIQHHYPARACASKGLCDRSWCLYIIYYISARTFFYLSKYSLSDAHFSTGRLLFEFNRLQYTLAAPEVFVSSANLQILLFCRLGTGSASSETQTFTRSKPHPYGYGIARQIPEEVRHASRNADSACPFLPSRQYKTGHAESAFRDACRTSSGQIRLNTPTRGSTTIL